MNLGIQLIFTQRLICNKEPPQIVAYKTFKKLTLALQINNEIKVSMKIGTSGSVVR